jgi:hypothetical protein
LYPRLTKFRENLLTELAVFQQASFSAGIERIVFSRHHDDICEHSRCSSHYRVASRTELHAGTSCCYCPLHLSAYVFRGEAGPAHPTPSWDAAAPAELRCSTNRSLKLRRWARASFSGHRYRAVWLVSWRSTFLHSSSRLLPTAGWLRDARQHDTRSRQCGTFLMV